MSFDNIVLSCQSVMEDWGDVSVPKTDMEEIIKRSGLAESLTEYYDFTNPVCGFDTCDREDLMAAFAKFIGARSWPTYGDAGTELERDFTEKYNAYKERVK